MGKNPAQKLIFELKDKLAVDLDRDIAPVSETDTDVIAADGAFGSGVVEAQAALQSIPARRAGRRARTGPPGAGLLFRLINSIN